MSTVPACQGPLNAAEARQLSQYLRQRQQSHQGLTLNQVKGYLFSIGCAPSPLFPDQWLAALFPPGTPGAPAWVVDALFRLQQQQDEQLALGTPKLPANARLTQHLKDNFQLGSALHEWSAGVALGLEHSLPQWLETELDDTELWPELESFWSMLTFFADEQLARTLRYEDGVTPPFGKVIELVRKQLPWLIKDYACLCQALFEESLPETDCTPRPLSPSLTLRPAGNDEQY